MNTVITLNQVSKTYEKRTILNQVSISVQQGEIYGLLGPSGCGKTTTVKMIAGIMQPDAGVIEVLHKKVPNFDVMREVCYMTQAAALYHTLSGYENLRFFGKLYGLKKKELEERIKETASIVNLLNVLHKQVKTYSGGMKQRLSLAIALLSNPKILLLDEPTVGIDPLLRQSIWEELRKLRDDGVTIVITTHVMDEVEKCDRLSMIRDGRILISGSPKEIMEAAGTESIEQAFIRFSKEDTL